MSKNEPDVSGNFDESLALFRQFLENHGYPQEIVWLTPNDVIATGRRLVYIRIPVPRENERLVRELYKSGMSEGRGVLFETVCAGRCGFLSRVGASR